MLSTMKPWNGDSFYFYLILAYALMGKNQSNGYVGYRWQIEGKGKWKGSDIGKVNSLSLILEDCECQAEGSKIYN